MPSKHLPPRHARSLIFAGAAAADLILLGRPGATAGGGGGAGGDALVQAAVLLLVLLGGALTFAFAFGVLPTSGPQGRGRSRQGGMERSGGDDPLLPRPPSALFPSSHHEKLHDAKYLRRMLEAEERRRRSGRRSSPRRPSPGDDPSSPQDPVS
jgi:hypothetical protein